MSGDARPTEGPRLRIEGAVDRPLTLGFEDLREMPAEAQVSDISRIDPARRGGGVALEAILRLASPHPSATKAILHADRDGFHVGLPLAPMRDRGVVVYRLDDGPMPPEKGGPFRMLVRGAAECHIEELDECANVKYLSRIEIV